jgi:hypothetical protein
MVPGSFLSGGFPIGSDSISYAVQAASEGVDAYQRRDFTLLVDALGTGVATLWMILVHDTIDGKIVGSSRSQNR